MTHDDDTGHTLVHLGPRAALTSEQAGFGHYLVAIEGTEPGRLVEVTAEPLTVGRDPKQSLVFADSEISRLHARVTLVGDALLVEDQRSTNGTYVDGRRIGNPTLLSEGRMVRFGRQVLKYERRNRRDVTRALELARDLEKASAYVASLLPAPLTDGRVSARWAFHPSAHLGGDAFGYDWIDPDAFAFYLIDVSGHGVGSAMHSVSAMNVLRQRVLPSVDFTDPAAVLGSLNDRFQMDGHNGLYFTTWYGVYRPSMRTLRYAAGGHHPSLLVSADRSSARSLVAANLMVGAVRDVQYDAEETTVPPGATVYVFSDGVFEFRTAEGRQGTLDDVLPLLTPSGVGPVAPDDLCAIMRGRSASGEFEDDFSLLAVTFA